MQMTKSKTDQSIPGIYIILSNISRGTAFLHQVVTKCGFRKLLRCNLHFFISLAFSHLHLKGYGWLAPSQGCCVSFLLCFVRPCLQVWISISLGECYDAENVLTCENQRSKGNCGDEEVAHVCSHTCMTFSCMQVTWPFGLEAARKWGGELKWFLSFAQPSFLATCTCVFQIRQTHLVF